MIKSNSYILVDNQGKEMQDKNIQLFDLTVNDGDIHQFAAGHIPSHWHREFEVFILLEGDIQIGIGDCTYRLKAGDGCFINTEVIHSFTAEVPSPCRYRSFVFSPEIVGGTPGSIFDTAYVRPLMENGVSFLKFQEQNGDSRYFKEFGRAFAACVGEEIGYEFQVRDALSNILLYVRTKNAAAVPRAIPSIQEARLKEMLLYIENNFDHQITVLEVANAANVCTRECQRIFNQYLHYNPIEYIRRKRIFNAARMLADSDGPVTEIALSCGFSDPSYFSRQFREIMDSTPSEYRTAVKENAASQGRSGGGNAD